MSGQAQVVFTWPKTSVAITKDGPSSESCCYCRKVDDRPVFTFTERDPRTGDKSVTLHESPCMPNRFRLPESEVQQKEQRRFDEWENRVPPGYTAEQHAQFKQETEKNLAAWKVELDKWKKRGERGDPPRPKHSEQLNKWRWARADAANAARGNTTTDNVINFEAHLEQLRQRALREDREDAEAEYERERNERESKRAPAGPPREFKLTPFDQIRFNPAVPYVVSGIVPRNGLVTAWGPPKCGKSFWAFDLAMRVALRWEYRGRKVEGGPVVYVAAEGGAGFAGRVEAWRQRFLAEDASEPIPFYLLALPLDLVAEHPALIAAIEAVEMADAPKLVVIDTLNRTLVGSENRPEDMAKFIRAADAIRVAFGCAVIVIHHCGIDGTRPRGHTSLAGADDCQIAVSRDSSGLIRVEVEHLKDGVAAPPFACRLENVEIGTLDDGTTGTSCVVVPAELTPAASGKGKRDITANQQRFLDILADAILDAPDQYATTINIPQGRTAISREWFKMCCKAKGWFDPEADDDNNRAKVSNMINALAGKRLIGASKLFVWDAR
jgi:AAA domain